MSPDRRRRILINTASGIAVLVGLVLMADATGTSLRIPEVDVASKARASIAWIAGLVMLAGSLYLVIANALNANRRGVLVGLLATALSLPLLGISLGIPPALEPLAGAFNVPVRLTNWLLGILEKLVS